MTIPKIALVVPCYNEELVLEQTASRLLELLSGMIENNKVSADSFIFFVNDGSRDTTWDIIEKLHEAHQQHIKGLKLSRNFGHQNALLDGMYHAYTKADAIISLDADLQDDISILGEFVDKFNEGYEIVYGVRKKRETDSFFKKITALTYYRLLQFLDINIVYNHADYRLLSRRVVAELNKFPESYLFLRGVIPNLGFKSTQVFYDRQERQAGETKYTFKRMFEFSLNGILSFSIKPIRLITMVGFLMFLFCIVMAVKAFAAHYMGKTVPGWTSLILSIYFIGSFQLIALGIIGEYIGRIYREVRRRPRFIEEKELL